MTAIPVIVQLPPHSAARDTTSIVDAARAALDVAAAADVDALLLPHADTPRAVDPTVLAGLLSTSAAGVPLLIEARTGDHAPFNLARRIQTLARITGGRAGVYLRDTGVDPVTAAHRPLVAAETGVAAEYARVLRRLWDSFPDAALRGDREAGVFADVDLIVPAHHEGDVYRVAGALNVPISPAHRPILLADAGAADADAAVDALVASTEAGPPGSAVPQYRPVDGVPGSEGLDRALTRPAEGVLLRLGSTPDRFAADLADALTALRALSDDIPASGLWRRASVVAVA